MNLDIWKGEARPGCTRLGRVCCDVVGKGIVTFGNRLGVEVCRLDNRCSILIKLQKIIDIILNEIQPILGDSSSASYDCEMHLQPF